MMTMAPLLITLAYACILAAPALVSCHLQQRHPDDPPHTPKNLWQEWKSMKHRERYVYANETPQPSATLPITSLLRQLRASSSNRRLQSTTDQIIGFAISATSPGFPWNGPTAADGADRPSFYCAGAALSNGRVRPLQGQPMTLLDCETALSSERPSSQILLEYSRDGQDTLNFHRISQLDVFADPMGWCVGLDRAVRRNEELVAEYCDDTSIEQVWRIIPEDNTWRPEEEWYTIDGPGLCVESKATVPQVGTELHLRPCTYDDQAARQRQSWIWCYQDTQCNARLSTPPDFILEIDCEATTIQSDELRCDDSFLNNLNIMDDGGGSIPSNLYNRLEECPSDPMDDKRFGRSLIYRIDTNEPDQYLHLNLDSTCADDGDDADMFFRVYEQKSDADWGCKFWSSTYCLDGNRSVRASLGPHTRDFLVLISDDGTGRDQNNFDLDLLCGAKEVTAYKQIQLTQDPNLCVGVAGSDLDTPAELFRCNEEASDLLSWKFDSTDRLLRLEANNNRCLEIDGTYQAGNSISLSTCNPARARQRWWYDRFNNDEMSSGGDDTYCVTYNTSRDSPGLGFSVVIDKCAGTTRQEWRLEDIVARSSDNSSPSPPTASPSALYCGDKDRMNVMDDQRSLPSDGKYDDLSCLKPEDVFDDEEDDSMVVQTFEIVDTAGNDVDIQFTSLCNGNSGDNPDNDAQTTLFRVFEIVEDDDGDVEEYQCKRSGIVKCKNESSLPNANENRVTFALEGAVRYLVVAAGIQVNVVECSISDGCTRGTGGEDIGRIPNDEGSGIEIGDSRKPEEGNLVTAVWVKMGRWRRRKRRRRIRKISCDGLVKSKPERWCFEVIARGQFRGSFVNEICRGGCASVTEGRANVFNADGI